MNKEAFLARLPKGKAPTEPRPEGPCAPPPADPEAALIQRLIGAGMGVKRVSGARAALHAALDLAREARAYRLGHSDLGPAFDQMLPAAAQRAGLELTPAGDGAPGTPGIIEPLPVGLTRADLAVAEVGCLVQAAAPGGGRLLSLLPPMHIALLHVHDILATMEDLAQALHDRRRFAQGPPPAVSLIGGPSKTADIEAVIVLGVHGPGRVEVIIWD